MTKHLIGIVICAYDRDVEYIGELAASVRARGHYTVICYDANRVIPDVETIGSCDYFSSGGGHKDRPNGHLRNMQRGHDILSDAGCKYSLCITGDAVLDMPENIPFLIDVLDVNAVMASQWGKAVGTMIYFGRTAVLDRALQRMAPDHPQNEKKFKVALDTLGALYKIYPCKSDDKGAWETIGYWRRHGNYIE